MGCSFGCSSKKGGEGCKSQVGYLNRRQVEVDRHSRASEGCQVNRFGKHHLPWFSEWQPVLSIEVPRVRLRSYSLAICNPQYPEENVMLDCGVEYTHQMEIWHGQNFPILSLFPCSQNSFYSHYKYVLFLVKYRGILLMNLMWFHVWLHLWLNTSILLRSVCSDIVWYILYATILPYYILKNHGPFITPEIMCIRVIFLTC